MIWLLLFLPSVFAQQIGDLTNYKMSVRDEVLWIDPGSHGIHNKIYFYPWKESIYTFDITENGLENEQKINVNAPCSSYYYSFTFYNEKLYAICRVNAESTRYVVIADANKQVSNARIQNLGKDLQVRQEEQITFVNNRAIIPYTLSGDRKGEIYALQDDGSFDVSQSTLTSHTWDLFGYAYGNLMVAVESDHLKLYTFDEETMEITFVTSASGGGISGGSMQQIRGDKDRVLFHTGSGRIFTVKLDSTGITLLGQQNWDYDYNSGTAYLTSDFQSLYVHNHNNMLPSPSKIFVYNINYDGSIDEGRVVAEFTPQEFIDAHQLYYPAKIIAEKKNLLFFHTGKKTADEQNLYIVSFVRYDGLCEADFFVNNQQQCTACPNGTTNEAGDSIALPTATSCDIVYCGKDQHVVDNVCTNCTKGLYKLAGDDASQGDTECDILYCQKDEKVVSNVCTACPPGTIRPAGDDATQGDTSCTQAICSENHRVLNNECVPCEDGLIRLAGDRADRADTQCFDASTCGGITCDPTGTKECVNHRCICNNFFGGQDCSKDRSLSARQKQLLKARKKALPTRANLKQRQKEVKDLAREILQEEIAKGVGLKQAIKNSKIEVELQDIQQEVQVIVAKMAKTPVLAVAPENKDETDTCDKGPQCASLDIAEEGDKITFLDTAEEVGSWTALANGDDIVSKQTRVSESVYEMQCWNNTWGSKTTVDVTNGGKLYECNGHIILVGSQASVCTPTTCQNDGTCSKDGLSFKCTCQDGFTGEFCESSDTMTHCHQMDCSDFGGHKAGECTECTIANCCNYASRSLFDAHCDTLTATQDFVNAKCCHRTYCL